MTDDLVDHVVRTVDRQMGGLRPARYPADALLTTPTLPLLQHSLTLHVFDQLLVFLSPRVQLGQLPL